jgi:hypothetical protein
MKLTDLELRGYGHFGAEHKGGFVITTPNLPALWDYITIRSGTRSSRCEWRLTRW